MTRTSQTHPLIIAEIQPDPDFGKIGLTFCPGKTQKHAATGQWARDLDLDLDAIADWNAAAIVTLMEEHELHALNVAEIGPKTIARNMAWYCLPIRDQSVPDEAFETAWERTGEALRARLRDGANILLHCMGGLGRTGTIAARLLVELDWEPQAAVAEVRKVRPGAIENATQLAYAMKGRRLAERQPAVQAPASRARAIGAMVGLAVGDAIGTTLEFKARDSYQPLTDMVGAAPSSSNRASGPTTPQWRSRWRTACSRRKASTKPTSWSASCAGMKMANIARRANASTSASPPARH